LIGAGRSASSAATIARFVSALALVCACAATGAHAQDSAATASVAMSASSVEGTGTLRAASGQAPAGATAATSARSPESIPQSPRGGTASADSQGFEAPFSSSKGPISIKSDSLALDYKGKIIVWTGNVHAAQSGTDLSCDVMHAYYGADFNDIKLVVADHNVKITQGGRWATSDHAVLDQAKRVITMTGNPVIHDGLDQITGTKVLVYLDSQKSVVEGPARAVIFPHKDKTRDNQQSGSEDHAAGHTQAVSTPIGRNSAP